MIPQFTEQNIWPYDVTLQGGRKVRINAASPKQAARRAGRQYRCLTAGVETVVVTSGQMHRILD